MKASAKPRNLLRGVVLLCRGRVEGFDEIGTGAQDFLSSLAPMIAFPLVGSLLMLSRGLPRDAATDFLATLCAVLAPPVISHALARYWRREAMWGAFRHRLQLVPVDAAADRRRVAAHRSGAAACRCADCRAWVDRVAVARWLCVVAALVPRAAWPRPAAGPLAARHRGEFGTMVLAVGPQLAQRYLIGGAG